VIRKSLRTVSGRKSTRRPPIKFKSSLPIRNSIVVWQDIRFPKAGRSHGERPCGARGAQQDCRAFAAINADDYYGPSAFEMMNKHLTSLAQGRINDYAMVGYPLGNTLSDFGTVSRGVCESDSHGYLKRIVERTKLEKREGVPNL
jgi:hypothetical protein